jgi:hypothetical protein
MGATCSLVADPANFEAAVMRESDAMVVEGCKFDLHHANPLMER